jgi:hypothetical protein
LGILARRRKRFPASAAFDYYHFPAIPSTGKLPSGEACPEPNTCAYNPNTCTYKILVNYIIHEKRGK